MIDHFRFYFKHSLNDLRVNGQRTLFAILAVAAGVAAIVSLQTVAVLIDDALTGNIQQQTRGDIRLEIGGVGALFEGDEEPVTPISRAVERGDLYETTSDSELDEDTYRYFHPDGIARMQAWLDENYPGSDITYRAVITDFLGLFTGTGTGSIVTTVSNDTQANQVLPLLIPADNYPFYDPIETVDGTPISELLAEPTDIVLGETVAETLDASVGDVVRLNGASADFTVRGIVPQTTASREPTIGLFGAIFGFYYLDASAAPLFDIDLAPADVLFVRLGDPDNVDEAARAMTGEFNFVWATTTTQILDQNTQIVAALDDVVTVVGLLGMLIGSIGIINTMQVVVRRRTLEVAVLKTIGLQAGQVTVLFLTEAFIMGVLGSIVGVLFGWAATLLIKGAATAFVGQELAFRIAWQPVLNGLFVGTLVTTVFGFMPTLSAGQVRPGIVLRPSQTVIPRAGFFRNLLAMIFTILALSLITRTILGGSYVQALAIVGGAFVAAGMMFVVLLVILWIIGRLLPSFGVVDLKVALRQMLTTRGRGATTLLALIVGIFALSTITMFTETFRNLLDFAIDEGTRGNVQVVSLTANTDQIVDAINTVEAVNSYWIDRRYEVTFNSVTKAGSGETVHVESLQAQMDRSRDQLREQGVTEIGQVSNLFSQIGGRTVDQIEGPDTGFVAGRNFTPADDGQPYIVLRASDTLTAAGIEPGDTLNFTLAGGIFGGEQTLSLEVIGIAASTDFNIEFSPAHYTLMGALPDGRGPDETSVQVDIPPENVRDLRRAIADVPGAIVLDLDLFLGFIQTLVEQFRAFPTLVAALGLAVGGIIIANSVALATIERRHEIAIMKSIGLQRERVLGMLLLENAILGLIGGLIGVGFGLVALSYFTTENEIPLDTVPYGTGALLMGLCILVALIAAMTSAWNASGEKPLNVLRYE